MFLSNEILAFIMIAIYLLALLVPLMLADVVFNKHGREVAAAVCYIISAVVYLSVWIVGLGMTISEGRTTEIVVFSVLSVIGLAILGLSIWALILEVGNRRNIIAETMD